MPLCCMHGLDHSGKNTCLTLSLRDICDVHTPLRGATSMFGSEF